MNNSKILINKINEYAESKEIPIEELWTELEVPYSAVVKEELTNYQAEKIEEFLAETNLSEIPDLKDIFEFLGELDESFKGDRMPILVSKTFLKKEREKSEDGDYQDKEDLYRNMVKYHKLRDIVRKMKDSIEEKKEMLDVRKYMLERYYLQAWKQTNGKWFRFLPEETKSDLVTEALIRAMNIGVEGRSNYGNEYWSRFDIENRTNVFSFWTTQINNFFFQHRKESRKQQDLKWEVLEQMKIQFQYDCINNYGCATAQFHYGSVIDGD